MLTHQAASSPLTSLMASGSSSYLDLGRPSVISSHPITYYYYGTFLAFGFAKIKEA